MFHRNLIVGILLMLSITFSFATKIDKTLFTHTTDYDLKRLNDDLKKNFDVIQSQKNCNDMWCGDGIPNYYSLKETNDTKIRQFLINLKLKKYQRATNLFNNGSNWGKVGELSLLPLPYEYPVNFSREVWGLVPFHEGLLGLISEGHDLNIKFFYITIKNNVLYEVRMNGTLYPYQKSDNTRYSIDDGKKTFTISPKNWEEVNIWLSNYIKGKEKSKELDERQNAFKTKVKKLFK